MIVLKLLKRKAYILLTGYFLFAISFGAPAQTFQGEDLLPGGLNDLVPFGQDVSDAMFKNVAVDGQSFTQAFEINTFNKSTPNGEYGLNANIKTALHKGNVLWISFKARCLESKKESGEAFVEVRLDQLVNGKYTWPSHLERGVSIGTSWSETSIPFVLKKDADPSDVRLVIKFDTYPQRFQIGPVTFKDYGSAIKITDLPRSVVHYDGDAPDAPWRTAANERINKYRKGDLAIKVVDKNGKPLPNTTVSIQLKKIAFGWGTATNTSLILDSVDPKAIAYRDTLLRYFNKVVLENEMKAKNWDRFNATKTIKGVNWFKAHNIDVRGHVMVWPSWQNSPQLVKYKNDTAALRAAIIKQIDEQTTVMKGQFTEWDVLNEPYAHHNIIDSLGNKNVMLSWFDKAHRNAPGVKLFLNDYTMFHPINGGSESFYNIIKYLKDNGAPINAIGEQSHIGGTPPGIGYILSRLDHFAGLGLPIQISEFDITSDDDDFKARYMHDFMTVIFSHPSTIGFMQWGFWEGSHWIPAAALWDKDWNIRPEGKVFTELVSETWNTQATGVTNIDGVYGLRGFNGDYEVVVKKGNRSITQQTSLSSNGQTVVIKMAD